MKKYILISLITLVAGGVVLRGLLRDDTGPFIETATASLGERIKRLVDEHELELNKAETKVRAADAQARELREKRGHAEAALATAKRRLELAQSEIKRAEEARQGLAEKLASGNQVRLSSGRVVSAADLASMDRELKDRLSLAGEKINYLKQIVTLRAQRVAQLEAAEQNAPLVLLHLHEQLGLLKAKLHLYKDVRKWLAEEPSDVAYTSGLFEIAQQTLEEAHARLDEKLSEADTLLRITSEQSAHDNSADTRLVNEIQILLAD